MESTSRVNLAEFLSVCVSLSELSGNVIREIFEGGDLGVIDKENNEFQEDKLTMADLQVQKSIEHCISQCFPSISKFPFLALTHLCSLAIIGEESHEKLSEIKPSILPEHLDRQLISEAFLAEHLEKRRETLEKEYPYQDELDLANALSFDGSEACLWIDPLDGTVDFVKGDLTAVTVIMGLEIKGRAKAGIVHRPFQDKESQLGRTFFGSVEVGAFSIPYSSKQVPFNYDNNLDPGGTEKPNDGMRLLWFCQP